jgi:hypothetical protein
LPLRPEPPDSRTAQLYAPIANQGQTPPK